MNSIYLELECWLRMSFSETICIGTKYNHLYLIKWTEVQNSQRIGKCDVTRAIDTGFLQPLFDFSYLIFPSPFIMIELTHTIV